MGQASLDKGHRGERDVVRIYFELLGLDVRRTLAGHRDDLGDLTGVPFTTIQVKNTASLTTGVREGLIQLKEQQLRSGHPFGVLWVKAGRGQWITVQTPQQHAALWREATATERKTA